MILSRFIVSPGSLAPAYSKPKKKLTDKSSEFGFLTGEKKEIIFRFWLLFFIVNKNLAITTLMQVFTSSFISNYMIPVP